MGENDKVRRHLHHNAATAFLLLPLVLLVHDWHARWWISDLRAHHRTLWTWYCWRYLIAATCTGPHAGRFALSVTLRTRQWPLVGRLSGHRRPHSCLWTWTRTQRWCRMLKIQALLVKSELRRFRFCKFFIVQKPEVAVVRSASLAFLFPLILHHALRVRWQELLILRQPRIRFVHCR